MIEPGRRPPSGLDRARRSVSCDGDVLRHPGRAKFVGVQDSRWLWLRFLGRVPPRSVGSGWCWVLGGCWLRVLGRLSPRSCWVSSVRFSVVVVAVSRTCAAETCWVRLVLGSRWLLVRFPRRAPPRTCWVSSVGCAVAVVASSRRRWAASSWVCRILGGCGCGFSDVCRRDLLGLVGGGLGGCGCGFSVVCRRDPVGSARCSVAGGCVLGDGGRRVRGCAGFSVALVAVSRTSAAENSPGRLGPVECS